MYNHAHRIISEIDIGQKNDPAKTMKIDTPLFLKFWLVSGWYIMKSSQKQGEFQFLFSLALIELYFDNRV